ncbi:hypothetical protein AAFM79_18765 [Trichormus azollae HNT15244]
MPFYKNCSTSSPENPRTAASILLLADDKQLEAVTTQSKKGKYLKMPLTISTLGMPSK